MLFIALLALVTTAIAGSAAFFSVYGLAATFSGVFWSVVAMGTSLEAGKLIAASFLYRYWTRINFALKSYLMLGVAALMLLTSVGIYGYLSAGYQQDALPLKQKQEQVRLLEDEKVRLLDRKEKIDAQLAGGPQIDSVQNKSGRIDPNAARVLRETNRGRQTVIAQYKEEQTQVNKRVTELDSQLLALKQDLIKVEAHTGPITYIAKSFGLDSDNATHYLIMIIIFAFDPMAVALTLAVNIALRLRKEEKEAAKASAEVLPEPIPYEEPKAKYVPEPEPEPVPEPVEVKELELKVEPVELELVPVDQPATEEEQPEIVTPQEPVEPPRKVEPNVVPIPDAAIRRRRHFETLHSGQQLQAPVLKELTSHRTHLKTRQDAGETLSRDEQWELDAINRILTKHGYSAYLN